MTRNRRRYGLLAAVGLAILLTLSLAACGSSSGGSGTSQPRAGASTPAAVMKALNQLTSCLSGQGVNVPSPITRRELRATIRDLPSAKRSSVLSACQTQVDALLAMRRGH